jgi:putative transposase
LARLPRLCLAGYPHHLIHRGNNRQAIFFDDKDSSFFMGLLNKSLKQFSCELNAYVLMSNHVHLLITPRTVEGLPLMMQALARDYARYFNKRYARTGTIWEGRYRSSVIDSERYLLACMAYIDLNPVRAGIARTAGEYSLSSYRHYSGTQVDPLITPTQSYWALGNTPFAREAAYRDMVASGLQQAAIDTFTDHALHGWALGEKPFLDEISEQTDRRLVKARKGRPTKQDIT